MLYFCINMLIYLDICTYRMSYIQVYFIAKLFKIEKDAENNICYLKNGVPI